MRRLMHLKFTLWRIIIICVMIQFISFYLPILFAMCIHILVVNEIKRKSFFILGATTRMKELKSSLHYFSEIWDKGKWRIIREKLLEISRFETNSVSSISLNCNRKKFLFEELYAVLYSGYEDK